jgi:transcription elongation factor Elf1
VEDEEAALVWQDVLDEVAAGRAGNGRILRCPFCSKGEISVDRNDQRLRLECRACKRFIEGRLNAPAI